jgi:hypothetical protein
MFFLRSFFSSILTPRTRTDEDIIDPDDIICDPNIMIRPSLFLLLFTSWASIPPRPSDANPEEILSQFTVQAIFHKKLSASPEHEFLLIETKKQSGEIKKFILDRTVSTTRDATTDTTAATEPEACSLKIIERIKKLIRALVSVAASHPSHLTILDSEETSSVVYSSGSQPGPAFDPLSIADKSTLSLTETASLVSDSLDISDNSPAFDRFLGENHVNAPRWKGEMVRDIQPLNLTLFELVVLSHVAHQLHPTYSLLEEQCFFFGALIFAAVDMKWGDAHGRTANNCGRINSYKDQWIDPLTVSSLIDKYEQVYSQKLDDVSLFIYHHSDYHLLRHSIQIMTMANARRDQTNWKQITTIVDEAGTKV